MASVGSRVVVVALSALLFVAALAQLAVADDADGSGPDRPPTTAINWRRCSPDEMGGEVEYRALPPQCARVVVPVDYEHPDGRTLSLFVSRSRSVAPDPLGPLFVNQGGPGKEAAQFALSFSLYPGLERFDVIGVDPRGTGRSTRVNCRSDITKVNYSTTESGAPTERYRDEVDTFVKGCADDPNLRFYGSNNVARDMDRIRELLGVEKMSYFGKSYGSDLGTAYLSLFPNRVRAAVLDGATDLTLDAADFYAQQARASRRAFDRYLDHCRLDGCAWTKGEDAEHAWTALVRQVGEEPVKDPNSDKRLTDDDLRGFQDKVWGLEANETDDLLNALVLDHDPSGLLPAAPNDEEARELDAFAAITCLDIPVHDFGAAIDRYRKDAGEATPDGTSILLTCSKWPKPADPISVRRAPNGIPVMVVSTRGDVPTPYESGVGLAKALDVPLLTWEANAHTGYMFSPCVREYTTRVLVDLQPPLAEGATCPDDNALRSAAPGDEPNLADA